MTDETTDFSVLLKHIRSIKRLLWVAVLFIVVTCVVVVACVAAFYKLLEEKTEEYFEEFEEQSQLDESYYDRAEESTRVLIDEADLRETREKLASAVSDTGRFYARTRVAFLSAKLGDFEEAETHSRQLLAEAENYQTNWNYGNAIHMGNLALGLVALGRDDVERAKTHLFRAAETPGSPQLNSFGPEMALARSLLALGEKDAVIEYLEACKAFWELDDGMLDKWIAMVRAGDTPQFSTFERFQ